MTDESRDRKLVENLAGAALVEQRARRRWGIFFKLIFFSYIITVSGYAAFHSDKTATIGKKDHVAVIPIIGPIAAQTPNSASSINKQLRRAFEEKTAKGVILQINSPGGSAVESNRIFREIRRLRKKYEDKQIYTVVDDLCASGGYFIAAASDKIYVDESSLVGSIGVIFSSFGFTGALEKLGVERRVITAGRNKNMLDPFLPKNPEDQERIKEILAVIQETFINAVRQGRGERLSADDEIFSGAVFDGKKSIRLGLSDGIGDTDYVAREIIGTEEIRYYEHEKEWLEDFAEGYLTRMFSFMSVPQIN